MKFSYDDCEAAAPSDRPAISQRWTIRKLRELGPTTADRPTATAAADSAAHQVVEALFGLEVKVAPAL